MHIWALTAVVNWRRHVDEMVPIERTQTRRGGLAGLEEADREVHRQQQSSRDIGSMSKFPQPHPYRPPGHVSNIDLNKFWRVTIVAPYLPVRPSPPLGPHIAAGGGQWWHLIHFWHHRDGGAVVNLQPGQVRDHVAAHTQQNLASLALIQRADRLAQSGADPRC